MAEWRAIKKRFFRDKKVTRLSRDARLLVLGMIALTDDEGYLEADAETLKNELYPGDPDVEPETIQVWLDEVSAVDQADPFVIRFLGASKIVVCFPKFANHQPAGVLRKDRVKDSKLKPMVEAGLLSAEDPRSPEPERVSLLRKVEPIGVTDMAPVLHQRTGKQVINDEILDAIAIAWKRSQKPEPSMAVYQEIASYCKDLNRDPEAVIRAILSRANSKPDIYALKFSRARKLPPELESGPKLDDWQIRKAKNDGRKTGLSVIGDVIAAATETRA